MKHPLKLIGLSIFFASILAIPMIGSSLAQINGMQMGSMGKSMGALEKATGKTFDIYWMSQMIAHHKIAVRMANFVLKNGEDARVKKAAQNIVKAQSLEVKQMTGWLKSWYDTKPDATQMKLMVTDSQAMIDASQGQGDPDKNFLENMVPHHQSAVDMGKLALKKALRPKLKKFAQGVIDVQSKEITQYKTWLKAIK